jgi:UDP-GlcNAc:undecaprenyl-phosphate GlcNAc-1-phosphate transferase
VAAIAGSQGYNTLIVPALALAGALAGFSAYNLPPARIYLGDCGSMTVGFVLSLLALQVSLDTVGSVNMTVVGLLLFVPLADTCLAIARRSLRGQSFMTADRGHVHHRLLDRGFGTWSVLAMLGCVSLLAGLTAWLTVVGRYQLPSWGGLAALSVLLINRRLVGHEEWALAKRFFIQGSLPFIRSLVPLERLGRAHAFRQPPTLRMIDGNEELSEAAEANYPSIDDDTWPSSKNKAA